MQMNKFHPDSQISPTVFVNLLYFNLFSFYCVMQVWHWTSRRPGPSWSIWQLLLGIEVQLHVPVLGCCLSVFPSPLTAPTRMPSQWQLPKHLHHGARAQLGWTTPLPGPDWFPNPDKVASRARFCSCSPRSGIGTTLLHSGEHCCCWHSLLLINTNVSKISIRWSGTKILTEPW